MSKIAPDHLSRQAFVYVRQSTRDQLRHHHESRRRRRQYGLADRARRLGWTVRGVGMRSVGFEDASVAVDRYRTAQHRRLFALGAELLVRRLRRADGRCS